MWNDEQIYHAAVYGNAHVGKTFKTFYKQLGCVFASSNLHFEKEEMNVGANGLEISCFFIENLFKKLK